MQQILTILFINSMVFKPANLVKFFFSILLILTAVSGLDAQNNAPITNSVPMPIDKIDKLYSITGKITYECSRNVKCPNLNLQHAENLAEALAQVQYTLERYRTLTAQGKQTTWRHYFQVRYEIIEKAGKLQVMEWVFAFQDAFHNLSKYSSAIADIVSLAETITGDYLLSEEFMSAFKNGKINLNQARQALNEKLNEFAKGRNQVSEVADATEAAIQIVSGLKQKSPDAPVNPDILTSTQKSLTDINGKFKQVTDVINFQMEMLGKGVASPADMQKLSRMKSNLRGSGLKVILGPLQDWSEGLRKEMSDRIDESHHLIAEEQKALGAAFRNWQQWNVANGLVNEAYAEIVKTQNLFYSVVGSYVKRQSYKSDPGPQLPVDASMQGVLYWNTKFTGQIARLDQTQRVFKIAEYAAAPSLKIKKKQFKPGESIDVEFVALPCYEKKAWIGIIPSTVPHKNHEESYQNKTTSQYLDKKPKGNLTFKAPSRSGQFDLRMFDSEDNASEVTSVTFKVAIEAEPREDTNASTQNNNNGADSVTFKKLRQNPPGEMGYLIVHTPEYGCATTDDTTLIEIRQNGYFVKSSMGPKKDNPNSYELKPPPYRFELKPGEYDVTMQGRFAPITRKVKIIDGTETTLSRGHSGGKLEMKLFDKSGNRTTVRNYGIVISDGKKDIHKNQFWQPTDHDAGLLPVGNYTVKIRFTRPNPPYGMAEFSREVSIAPCKTVTLDLYEDGRLSQHANEKSTNAGDSQSTTRLYKAKWKVTFEYTVGSKQTGEFYALLKENGKWDFAWKEGGKIDFPDYGDWKIHGYLLTLTWKEPSFNGTYEGVLTNSTSVKGTMTSSQGYMGKWTANKIEK